MKIIRSKGQSYTVITEDASGEKQSSLGRGLTPRADKILTPGKYRGTLSVQPKIIPAFVGEDYSLILRQTISVLDKVVRKKKTLRYYNVDAYADRVHLAAALWKQLCDRFEEGIRALPDGAEAFKKFEGDWNWKAHPYAKKPVEPNNPRDDDNAKMIGSGKGQAEKPDQTETRKDYEGRWHKALWVSDGEGTPDFGAIADKIMGHLFDQELQIDGDVRRKKGRNSLATGKGLLEERGISIKKSASDPRTRKHENRQTWTKAEVAALGKKEKTGAAKTPKQEETGAPETPEETPPQWSTTDIGNYFEEDVAAKIYADIKSEMKTGTVVYDGTRVGKILHSHFQPVLGKYEEPDMPESDIREARRGVWRLHNKVRQFYQKLVRSERFRRAFRDATTAECREVKERELEKLWGRSDDEHSDTRGIVPKDSMQLRDILGAKAQNADVSELIRLGKLVAHAADFPANADLSDEKKIQKCFKSRMDYLVTSAGQSEIKRNEAFTRVWRTSVGLSLQTLKAWLEWKTKVAPKDDDLTDFDNAKNIYKNFEKDHAKHFSNHLPLIFGSKEHEIEGKRASRAGLFRTDTDQNEIFWAFQRLASEIRNRTNHFNTKQRLIDLVTKGVLTGTSSKKVDQRPKNHAHEKVLEKFKHLLCYDVFLQNQVLADEMNRLELTRYATLEQCDDIKREMGKPLPAQKITSPRFMAVLRRIQKLARGDEEALAANLKKFAALDLRPKALVEQGENSFKVGLLRHLYSRGFAAWLANKKDEEDFIQKGIADIVARKKIRSKNYNEKKHIYAKARSLADELRLSDSKNLNTLFGTLHAETAAAERLGHSYNADGKKQRNAANQVDEFRQDLFAYFFAAYIDDQNLTWVWDARNLLDEGAKPKLLTFDDFDFVPWQTKDWHSQFYAWLYLIPSEHVAQLQHQFRKTAALETIGNNGIAPPGLSETLGELDRLMGLYTMVQQAGFSGEEHLGKAGFEATFYENTASFKKVYSDAADDHKTSLAGTRRGLRQIMRFGHFDALKKIYERHRITDEEVEEFTSIDNEATKALFEQKSDLRESILKLVEDEKTARNKGAAKKTDDGDQEKLKGLCAKYKEAAPKVALHNFKVGGARLDDHVRLHRLMMRIITRLTDFTLTWERDRLYLFLGMLVSELGKTGESLRVQASGDSRNVTLLLPDAVAKRAEGTNGKFFSQIVEKRLPLWDAKMGILITHSQTFAILLSDADRQIYERYFYKLPRENPKDVEAESIRSGEERGSLKTKWQVGKHQIRHDLAHFNVIRHPLKLAYVVNAVRSLMAYDRKLENAVAQSIGKILYDEGFEVTWPMEEGRLRQPEISPRLETHLTMVRGDETFEPAFKLPMRSVRLTSMVKALFGFETGGYRDLVVEGSEKKAKGPLRYPRAFRDRHQGKINPAILNVEFGPWEEKNAGNQPK